MSLAPNSTCSLPVWPLLVWPWCGLRLTEAVGWVLCRRGYGAICVCGQRDGKCFSSPRLGALALVALSVWFKEGLSVAQAEGPAVRLLMEDTSHQKSAFLWLLSGWEHPCCRVLHVASKKLGTEHGVTMQGRHLLGLKRRSWFGCQWMEWGSHTCPNITPPFRRKSRDACSQGSWGIIAFTVDVHGHCERL